MPAVGPELPPHLAKRKRSIDDDAEDSKSPPRKVQAATTPRALELSAPAAANPDELDIDESSEDDYGPSLQPAAPAKKQPGASLPAPTVGPSLPPPSNPDELDVDDSSEDDYGPSLRPSKPPTQPARTASPHPKRVLGPSLPPAPLSERPADDTSDSDDDYGPSLPPPPGSAAEAALNFQRREEEERQAQVQASAKPKRDDWMMVPPSDSDWSSRVDPTKLKNRKFQSGKGARAPADKSAGGISAIWTETPEEKRRRLEDEVLGRKDAATAPSSRAAAGAGSSSAADREDEATARRIQEYNERNRGRSLYDEHQQGSGGGGGGGGGGKEKDDDPSARAFDREKDMALGGRLGHAQKKAMLSKAADFGSRFQKGKYL